MDGHDHLIRVLCSADNQCRAHKMISYMLITSFYFKKKKPKKDRNLTIVFEFHNLSDLPERRSRESLKERNLAEKFDNCSRNCIQTHQRCRRILILNWRNRMKKKKKCIRYQWKSPQMKKSKQIAHKKEVGFFLFFRYFT